MSKVYVITEKTEIATVGTRPIYKNIIVGVLSKLPSKLSIRFSSYSVELDDPELLNRIAKEGGKK